MRRASTITLLSLALLPALLLTAQPAEACSCTPPLPPVEAARDVDVVFHAQLVSVSDVPKKGQYDIEYNMFTFTVLRTFKGQLDAQVNIRTAEQSAACGRTYGDPGSEWLIYARVDDQGQTYDSLCSRTKAIADAASDIAELEAAAGTLDQPNEPAVVPGPSEPEPVPVMPDEPTEPEAPEPTKPGKKGCSVSDSETGLGLGLGLGVLGLLGSLGPLGMARARRRR